MKTEWFEQARYGLFIHFGLFSTLGRGEWVVNKEEIPPSSLRKMAEGFHPNKFDAASLADLAVAGGMKYVVFTTMHHEGFRMYHSELTEFCATKTGPRRDLVQEIIQAARARGLKIGLYHSLNNWYDQPDSVAALESPVDHEIFIKNTHSRIGELVKRYDPIDVLWYDGWWPFDAKGWQAESMNEMVKSLQPQILFNGRNGLPGDFATPEQHLTPPKPWRPWEACVTLNDNWGYHSGDQNWKSPVEIIKMLAQVAQGKGNLLLNIGPKGDGSVPAKSVETITKVGNWLRIHGECIFGTDLWTIDPYRRGDHAGDYSHHGLFTRRGSTLYLIGSSLPEDELILTGLECEVKQLAVVGGEGLDFQQQGSRLQTSTRGLSRPDGMPVVLRMECNRPPEIYKTGGMRVPACPHPRYDPMPSDISW